MALSGSVAVRVSAQHKLLFSWTAVQNQQDNTSTVSWRMLLQSGESGQITAQQRGAWSVTIEGRTFSGIASLLIGSNAAKTLCTGIARITHDPDGTKTFSALFRQAFNLTLAGTQVSSVSGVCTGTLDTIQRVSQPTLSADAVALGQPLSIATNRQGPFTHTLEYSFGDISGVIAQDVETGCQWVPDPELARQLPNALGGKAIITCATYEEGVCIGTRQVLVTLTVPENMVPTVSASWEDRSGAEAQVGCLVQQVSNLAVSVDAAGCYGSTVHSAELTLGGKRYSGGILTEAGAMTLTVTVTDSRGRKATASYPLTVAAYAIPTLSVRASRCRDDGLADDTGAFARVTLSGNVTELAGRNSALLTLLWGEESMTWEQPEGQFLREQIIPADPGGAMTITGAVKDQFVTVERVMALSNGYPTLDLLAGGRGIAFGKEAAREGFDCAMAAFFSGGLYQTRPDGTTDTVSLFDRVAALEEALGAMQG